MNFIRRLLGDSDGMGDMVYAYKKGLPLILAEMGMRQNREDIGRFVRLEDTVVNGRDRPTWGAWLALSISNHIVNVAPKANVRLYNAWGELQAVGDGPNTSYLIQMGGLKYPGTLCSDTAVARLLVDTLHEEDGANITINSIIPLVNPYTVSSYENIYKSVVIEPIDPQELPAREYLALLNTLVAANPTKDARLIRGLNYSDAAPAFTLERVRIKALNLTPDDMTPRTKFGAQ